MVRQKVESTRVDVIRWMRKRWTGIKLNGGFDTLEGWALKEISDGTCITNSSPYPIADIPQN
jgi:hypothetical protein